MKRASESSINNREPDILSAVYFPLTFISPSLVEALSVCLDRIVLYRPVGSPVEEHLQPWVTRGFLRIRTPFEDVIDKTALRSRLQECRTWASSHHTTDLAYMKQSRDHIGPIGPEIPRIVSEIKGNSPGKTLKGPSERDFAVQLFLLLAQNYDQQSWELREGLQRFKLQQQSLEAFLRADRAEERGDIPSAEAFPGPKEGWASFMIENRGGAWNHIFQRDLPESTLLFTDSPAAQAWLLEAEEEKIEVLKFPLPSPTECAEDLPWKASFQTLLRRLLVTPWSGQLEETVKETRDGIEQVIDHWKASTAKPGETMLSFHWAVLPRKSPNTFLNARCGVDAGLSANSGGENTVVGLVVHDAQT